MDPHQYGELDDDEQVQLHLSSPDHHSPDDDEPLDPRFVRFFFCSLLELLIKPHFKDIYRETTGKEITKDCHILLTEDNFQEFARNVDKQLAEVPADCIHPDIPLEGWTRHHFSDLHSARMLIMALTTGCGYHGPQVLTVEQMEEFIETTFAGLVKEPVKIGLPQEHLNYNGDYDRMRLALKRTYEALPILGLIDKFKSCERGTIDRAVRYFGVEHIKFLNDNNFWDLFESAEKLKEYMDESPEYLSHGHNSVKVYQVQECLFMTLMDCLTPDFKDKFGYSNFTRRNSKERKYCVSELVGTLRCLSSCIVNKVSTDRLVFSQKPQFVPGGDNRAFFQWIREMNAFEGDFRYSREEEGSNKRQRQEEEDVEDNKRVKVESDEEELSEQESEQELSEQEQSEQEQSEQDLSEHDYSYDSDSDSEDQETTVVQNGLPSDHAANDVFEMIQQKGLSNFEQLRTAKNTVFKVLQNNPKWCPVCAVLAHSKKMTKYTHEPEHCPLKTQFPASRFANMFKIGAVANHLGILVSKKQKLSYIAVFTDGSMTRPTKKTKGRFQRCGVGVWFGEGDPDNTCRPVHAKDVLETELAAIVLALRIIRNRQGTFYYEIFCDSVAAGNLIHNYTQPKSKSTKKLVDEAKSLLDSAHGKVKLSYVKGHSDSKGNEMAHKLANEGRLKKR